MSNLADFEDDDQPQSDFCNLDIYDDVAFFPCHEDVEQESNRSSAHIPESRGDGTPSRSRQIQPQALNTSHHQFSRSSALESDGNKDALPRNSEDRFRTKSSATKPASEINYNRTEHEVDFTRITTTQSSSLFCRSTAIADINTEYGLSCERSHAKSRVSAYEDLCNFYDDGATSVDVSEVLSEDVDHPLDIAWLSDRCDGDVRLLVAVLETFVEQGGNHCAEISNAVVQGDLEKLCFHTVSASSPACPRPTDMGAPTPCRTSSSDRRATSAPANSSCTPKHSPRCCGSARRGTAIPRGPGGWRRWRTRSSAASSRSPSSGRFRGPCCSPSGRSLEGPPFRSALRQAGAERPSECRG